MVVRIPRRIHLPFGYWVAIKQMTRAEVRKANEGDDSDGLWDIDRRAILVVKSLPTARKCWVITHELKHAVEDWQHHCVNEGIARG